jgi:hypothetical protein
MWKNPWQDTRESKWSLLKVRGGNYKRESGGTQVESGGRENEVLQVLLNPMLTYGKVRTR